LIQCSQHIAVSTTQSDIYQAFDHRQSTVLVALDQSTAFDCVDHSTLLTRLHSTFGVTDAAPDWIQSYLHARQSFVRYGQSDSAVFAVNVRIPQGSSLGPLLSALHISLLSAVIRQFGLNYMQYADDSHVYIAADRPTVANLHPWKNVVHTWLLHNSLCLNPAKSDAIVFTPSRQQHTTKLDTVSVSGQPVVPSTTVKSLGVVLDNMLSMDQHVADVCKNCYFHIRALHHVRASLPDDVVRTVACSIVQSRLDYCNALFTGMSEANLSKLQRVQNTLARVVLRRGKYEHITPALSELHWLPVRQRIDFKVAIAHLQSKTIRTSYLFFTTVI